MLFFAILIAASGQAAGYAAGLNNCKEAKQIVTGWAVPPPSPEGHPDQTLVSCWQDYQKMIGMCAYGNAAQTACTVLVDIPREDRWQAIAVECSTGKPISTQKI